MLKEVLCPCGCLREPSSGRIYASPACALNVHRLKTKQSNSGPPKDCPCGCGASVKPRNTYASSNCFHRLYPKRPKVKIAPSSQSATLCPCGCGKLVSEGNKWATSGCRHRGTKLSEKRKEILREEGQKYNAENKENISKKMKEMHQDPAHREAYLKAMEELRQDPKYQEKRLKALRESMLDPELRESRSEISKQNWQNQDYREKVCASMKDLSPEVIAKKSETATALWKDPKFREKMMNSRKESRIKKLLDPITRGTPNSLERLIQNLSPENVLFTGNGAHWIRAKGESNSRNPDFIVLSEQHMKLHRAGTSLNQLRTSAVIEAFGDYWHGPKITGKDKETHEKEVIEYYRKAGISCLVVWESETKDKLKVTEKILSFIRYWVKWELNRQSTCMFELYYS